jgi:hypothetical protein
MLITRISPYSGKKNTKDINVTEEQLNNWANGMLIQRAMPNVSIDDREFIINGMTKEDYEEMQIEE